MPSPIAHSVSGYAITQLWPKSGANRVVPLHPWLLGYTVFMAIAADLDFIPQILTGDRYHHGPTHSVTFAVATALVAWWLFRFWDTKKQNTKKQRLNWSASQIGWLTLALYSSHLALDLVTQGGAGIQLFWPFSREYYQSSILIFPTTGWSKALLDPTHFVFLVFELGYSAFIIVALKILKGKRPLKGKE